MRYDESWKSIYAGVGVKKSKVELATSHKNSDGA